MYRIELLGLEAKAAKKILEDLYYKTYVIGYEISKGGEYLIEIHDTISAQYFITPLQDKTTNITYVLSPSVFFTGGCEFRGFGIEGSELEEFISKLTKLWRENEGDMWWLKGPEEGLGDIDLRRTERRFQHRLENNLKELIDESIMREIIE